MATLRQRYERNFNKERLRSLEEQRLRRENDVNQMLNERETMMDKAISKRVCRLKERMDQERDRQDDIIQKAYEKEKHLREMADTERLARELQNRRDEEYNDEQRRLKVRLNSVALRDLESKLRNAYQSKAIAAQMVEKRALKYDELVRDAEINRVMVEEAERAEDAIRKKELKLHQDKLSRIKDYQDTLAAKEKADTENAVNEYNADRVRVDDIIRKVNQEEEEERKMIHEKKLKTREMLQNGMAERQRRLQEDIEKEKLMDSVAKEYQDIQDARKARSEESRKLREEISANLADKLFIEKTKKEDEANRRLRLRQMMLEFEEDEKARKHAETEKEKAKKTRKELRANFEEQIKLRKQQREQDRAEDEAYRRDAMVHFEAKEKEEEEKEKIRKFLKDQYGQDLRDQLAARQEQFEHQQVENMKMDQKVLQEQQEFREIEEEERYRMLKEHAPKLVGYLPPGVFRDMEEIRKLGGRLESEYQPMPREFMPEESFRDPQVEKYKLEKEQSLAKLHEEARLKRKRDIEEYRKRELVFNGKR